MNKIPHTVWFHIKRLSDNDRYTADLSKTCTIVDWTSKVTKIILCIRLSFLTCFLINFVGQKWVFITQILRCRLDRGNPVQAGFNTNISIWLFWAYFNSVAMLPYRIAFTEYYRNKLPYNVVLIYVNWTPSLSRITL